MAVNTTEAKTNTVMT